MMKKLLFISLTLLVLQTKAQIINPGFETWSNDLAVPTAMNPNAGNGTWGWWDFNVFNNSFVGSSPVTVMRSDTAHGGQYSARIETKVFTSTSYGIYQTWGIPYIGHNYSDTLGILFNGNLNEAGSPSFKPGWACSQKIAQFSFWYLYKPNGVDTAECRVLLHQSGTPVAGAIFKTNVATGSTWQQATMNLIYVSGLTPDTLYIHFSSSSLDKNPKPGSVMWIDDVSVTLVTGVEENEHSALVSVYPNPANDLLYVEIAGEKAPASLLLYDTNGKLVLSETIKERTRINTQTMSEGIYTMRIISDQKVYNKKVMIVR